MKDQEIKETLSDIRSMMERSQKVMYVDGTSGILAGIWALLGAVAVSLVLYGSAARLWGGNVTLVCETGAGTIFFVAMICAAVFVAAFLSVWIMSGRKAQREGLAFSPDAGTRRMLGRFFSVMVTGGLVCLTPVFNGYWELVPGYMLVFCGLAMVFISPVMYRISVSKYMGYGQILLGMVALCLPQYGMICWNMGFCILHVIWGVWFKLCFDRQH